MRRLIERVKRMDAGTVTAMHATSGGEMTSIIASEPATVTRPVRICTRSAEMHVVTTSMSYDTRLMMSPA